MDGPEMDGRVGRYYTYECRLDSFQTATQPISRRRSNAKDKAPEPVAWPHKDLNPRRLAEAGFFFEPTIDAPDNTVCFLCLQAVSWEDKLDVVSRNDEAMVPEYFHLKLSPHCGWAILAATQAGLDVEGGRKAGFETRYETRPDCAQMVKARKATFGGRWPHEGKRGWKCKTKQLAEAGWMYTPTLDSDDMATCPECELALDGWEPKDNPMDEHHRRSPDCPFFQEIWEYKVKNNFAMQNYLQTGRKVNRAHSYGAKATPGITESQLETSIMSTTSGTKRGRVKKDTAAKAKKTRTKKEEAVEVLEDAPALKEELPLRPSPKVTRGRKRTSDALEDSVMTTAEAPAAKKRATRSRKTNNTEVSVVEQEADQEMQDAHRAPRSKAKGKKSNSTITRKTRKTSTASTVSASVPDDVAHLMDDEELDQQLQADLDRPLSEDENIAADSDSDRKKAPAKSKGKKRATAKEEAAENQDEAPGDHAMFDPEPPQIDEAVIDAELKAMEASMDVQPQDTLRVPKKGRKAATREASKQVTKKPKAQEVTEPEPLPVPETQPEVETAAVDELTEGHDMSTVSNSTVVRTSLSSNTAPKKRGRPSKKAAAAATDTKSDDNASSGSRDESSPQADGMGSADSTQTINKKAPSPAAIPPSLIDKPLPPHPVEMDIPQPPATPMALISPAPAARQAVVSPSPSPQSSDAENEPPSSKPSNTAKTARVALAPVPATPVRASPSKRNVLADLQTNIPWTAADVEMIFDDLDKESTMASVKGLKNGTDLTSPEKKMTVEEWIHHNAEEAEEKLRKECETTVSAFEREGTRAMQALEGLIVDE
ncbi:hypothetical protein GGR54DRAFT_531842 [Hypoxylon sp. NC1633]|nr:hypothetical protein GGR54DRAFT_531842 [Hypoxylon sp. NC1633]